MCVWMVRESTRQCVYMYVHTLIHINVFDVFTHSLYSVFTYKYNTFCLVYFFCTSAQMWTFFTICYMLCITVYMCIYMYVDRPYIASIHTVHTETECTHCLYLSQQPMLAICPHVYVWVTHQSLGQEPGRSYIDRHSAWCLLPKTASFLPRSLLGIVASLLLPVASRR